MEELSWNGLVTHQSRVDWAIIGALNGQELSGFEIWRWLGSEPGTSGLLDETDLYPTLYRLEAEGLLLSDWHEAERTRRKYRPTVAALDWLGEHAASAPSVRGTQSGGRERGNELGRADRAISPDPESGSWFLPPLPEAPATAVFPGAARDRDAGAVPGSTEDGRPADEPADGPAQPARERDDAGSAAVARYAGDLGAGLDLPRIEAERVRQEIADHLADSSAALRLGGLEAEAATAEAIRGLGEVHDLAARIGRAQHTKARLDRARARAAIEFAGEVVIWLALSVAVFVVSPGLADIATVAAGLAGLHLVVLTSAEWATNQMAVMLCIGAFAAGRLSMGYLAQISRHRDPTLRKRWALGGAAAVLLVALVLPGYQDGLVVATLLAAPFAFVAGTFRPKHQNESSYTWRGLGVAVAIVLAIILLPAARIFAYDPNGTPGTPLAPGAAEDRLTVDQRADGTYDYIVQPAATGAVTVELWPAATDGPFVVVDPSATGPAAVAAHPIDLSKLPPYRQWWVVAVASGPGGRRTAVAVAIQTGLSSSPGTALGWLISRL